MEIVKFSNKYEWFIDDVSVKKDFKYSNIKEQTEKDQSCYLGHLKLDYTLQKVENLNKGSVVIVKPNFVPCMVEETISAERCKVSVLNTCQEIEIKEILTCKSPVFDKPQSLMFFNEK